MSYLWYVMEKARLLLVREKRALATPLELGSHESVTPVSTATKSADGESAGHMFIVTISVMTCACVASRRARQGCVCSARPLQVLTGGGCALDVCLAVCARAPPHQCGSPRSPPPPSSGRTGRCRICGGRPPSLCLSPGSSRSCPAPSPSVSCHPHL